MYLRLLDDNPEKLYLTDDYELYLALTKSFPNLIGYRVINSYMRFCLLLLTYVASCVSIPELQELFGPVFSPDTTRTKINRYVKTAHLYKRTFRTSDRNTYTAYSLTRHCMEDFSCYVPCELLTEKPYTENLQVSLHEYALGISLLEFISLQVPFSIQKEVGYQLQSSTGKNKGSLYVDAVITMDDDKQNIIYVEQDMGTETNQKLCSKLNQYYAYSLHGTNGALLISCHYPMPYPSYPAYDQKSLIKIWEDMNEELFDNPFTYYESCKEGLDKKVLLALMQFMVRVNIATAVNQRGEPIPFERITTNSILKPSVNYLKFTMADFHEYITGLSNNTNPYLIRHYNEIQCHKTKSRFRNMCHYYIATIQKNMFFGNDLLFLLSAFPCLVYPSIYASHSYREHILLQEKENIEKLLNRYYYGFLGSTCKRQEFIIDFIDAPKVWMNNCYQLTDGSYIIYDFISCDVSAYVRFFYLYHMRKYVNRNIHLIGIGNEEDILYLAKEFSYHLPYGIKEADKKFFMCFTTPYEFHEKGKLYYPCKSGDNTYRLEPLVSHKEKELRDKIIATLSPSDRKAYSIKEITRQ